MWECVCICTMYYTHLGNCTRTVSNQKGSFLNTGIKAKCCLFNVQIVDSLKSLSVHLTIFTQKRYAGTTIYSCITLLHILSRWQHQSKCQHTYQIWKSTITAMQSLVNVTERAQKDSDFMFWVFLHTESPFDNTSIESIGKTASRKDMKAFTIKWIVSLLAGRRILV